MEENKMKNIVILKNLPSNIVEEAIVVLKENKKKLLFSEISDKKQCTNNKSMEKEYILKEAEMVISDYISNIENKKDGNNIKNKCIEKKYKRLRFISAMLFIVLIAIAILKK